MLVWWQLAEHEKALDILVTKLHDFSAAEAYCITASQGKDMACRKHIFLLLLSIYLKPGDQ